MVSLTPADQFPVSFTACDIFVGHHQRHLNIAQEEVDLLIKDNELETPPAFFARHRSLSQRTGELLPPVTPT